MNTVSQRQSLIESVADFVPNHFFLHQIEYLWQNYVLLYGLKSVHEKQTLNAEVCRYTEAVQVKRRILYGSAKHFYSTVYEEIIYIIICNTCDFSVAKFLL